MPAAIAGRSDVGIQDAARVDHGLPRVQPERVGDLDDRVVGDGEDHELDVVHQGVRLGEPARPGDPLPELLPATGVPRRDRPDRPARPVERDAERGPDRPRADDPDHRALAGTRVGVRMGVVARVFDVAVAMVAGLDGIERDALVVQLAQRLVVLGVAPLLRRRIDVVGLVPALTATSPCHRGDARYASMRRV